MCMRGVCLAVALVTTYSVGQMNAESVVVWGSPGTGLTDVPRDNDFVAISAGTNHVLALKQDGSLVAWGNNNYGCCDVPSGNNYIAMAGNGHFSVAIKQDGSLVAWGWNKYGQCDVPAGNDFKALAAGSAHCVALKQDGTLVAWGANDAGQCNVPSGVFAAVSADGGHCLAIRQDGSLVAWGSLFLSVPGGNDFTAVAVGSFHCLALRSDGSLVAWPTRSDGNDDGECDVPAGNDFVAIAAGLRYSVALKQDGSLVAWGNTWGGACEVPLGSEFVAVTTAMSTGFALTPNSYPVADPGPDQTVEATGEFTEVHLDATGSADPDDDLLTFEWSVPDGVILDDPFSPVPSGLFPVGPTLVTVTVADGRGLMDHADVLINVQDTTRPVVICTTDVGVLWPPSHQLVDVAIAVQADDEVTNPQDLLLMCSAASSEPDDAKGDGAYAGDVDGLDGYRHPVPINLIYDEVLRCFFGVVSLRAERDGSEAGRTYSIVCEVVDASGNQNTASCVVIVPHDRRKN